MLLRLALSKLALKALRDAHHPPGDFQAILFALDHAGPGQDKKRLLQSDLNVPNLEIHIRYPRKPVFSNRMLPTGARVRNA